METVEIKTVGWIASGKLPGERHGKELKKWNRAGYGRKIPPYCIKDI